MVDVAMAIRRFVKTAVITGDGAARVCTVVGSCDRFPDECEKRK